MSEINVEPQHQQRQVNGIVPHTSEDASESSLKKKRLLMDFANGQRDLFIKTLVLSDWSRNEADMGKLTDVKVWQDRRRLAQIDAASAIGRIEANMKSAKVPAPNIEGAMELLSTGKASWVPDLSYVPPKRLTARQLLKTLRKMNVILATRLSLHEDLPPNFSDFSIADGRAAFTVRDEFEVNLSVADEDPATSFYFIDIRLLFKPASNILNDRLRGFLEAKVNQELASNGLRACHDFLHNFVITHKLNILRSQATELIRGKWFDCIRPENMRRSLIVQYWAGLPGPKSWLEFGISSGKKEAARSRQPAVPQLSVRWFRKGSEVKDDALQFDWRDLDLEKCLIAVIQKHIGWILQDLQERIRKLAGLDSVISAVLRHADELPVLVLNRPSMKQSLHISIEPITGQFSISPPSGAATHTEGRLNNEVSIDVVRQLTSLTSALVQDKVHREADLLGWSTTQNMTRQDNLQNLFGEAVRHLSVFTPSSAWSDGWALVVTFTSSGEKWWAVSLEEKLGDQGRVTGKIFAAARHVPQPESLATDSLISKATMTKIERSAVAEVAFCALAKQLKDMRIPYTLERQASSTMTPQNHDGPASTTPSSAMFIRFSSLMGYSDRESSKTWAAELVRLTHHGISMDTDQSGNIRHDLRISLEPRQMVHIQKYLTKHEDRDLAMNSTGGLAVRFLSPFGQPFVGQIQGRLRSVERLDRWMKIIKANGFKCTRASLSKLAFTYSESPQLGVQLSFNIDGSLPIRLKLDPPASNPHQRIRVMLEQNVNNKTDKMFETFVPMLAFTLPVLTTSQRLQSVHPQKQMLILHPRSSTWYTLKYLTPLPNCIFQVRARKRIVGGKKLTQWFVELSKSNGKPASELDEGTQGTMAG